MFAYVIIMGGAKLGAHKMNYKDLASYDFLLQSGDV